MELITYSWLEQLVLILMTMFYWLDSLIVA